uniref:rhomboid protease n=1 Tax=Petromyzon marinus TaxID=7757 RepID=A0AAJ7XF61_PETMA|nr:rhomboid-related protein 1-like [Petromyzon marinus]
MDEETIITLIRDECDVAGTGYVGLEALCRALRAWLPDLEPAKLALLLALSARDGTISYRDFVHLLHTRRSSSFMRAVTVGRRRRRRRRRPRRAARRLLLPLLAAATLVVPARRARFVASYSCRPPALAMLALSVTQVCVYAYCAMRLHAWLLQTANPDYLLLPLVYSPQHRQQLWRLLTYALVHSGLAHVAFNVSLQLLLGVPLEMAHGTVPVLALYLAGVLAGSLVSSVIDMSAPLVGASGGVYALLSAHFTNVVLHWSDVSCTAKPLFLAIAVLGMSAEVGRAVWCRFSAAVPPQPGFAGHVAGSLLGITLGAAALGGGARRCPLLPCLHRRRHRRHRNPDEGDEEEEDDEEDDEAEDEVDDNGARPFAGDHETAVRAVAALLATTTLLLLLPPRENARGAVLVLRLVSPV